MLQWSAVWLAVWSMLNIFFTVLLFFGKSDGVYRAMQLYMLLTTVILIRTDVMMFMDMMSNPEYYHTTVAVAAVIAPMGAFSAIYLAYQVWKVRNGS